MTNRIIRDKKALFSATAAAAISVSGAYAQNSVFEDEIVVTAQKREENAQDRHFNHSFFR